MLTQLQLLFGKLSTEFAQYILRWHYVRKKLATWYDTIR